VGLAETNSIWIFSPWLRIAAAEGFPGRQDVGGHALPGRGLEEHVDESRPGDLGFFHPFRFGQGGQDGLGDLPGVALQRLGQLHGRVAGEIAVAELFGAFQFHRDGPGLWKLGEGLGEQGGQVGFGGEVAEHGE
jgi:hypothetical protein